MPSRMAFEPGSFVNFFLPLIFASVVIDENLTFALLALSFFCNPTYYRAFADDRVRIFLKRVFLLFCAVIVLVVANGSLLAGTGLSLIIEQQHRLFILLLLAPVIADLTYVSLRQIPIDAMRIHRVFHIGLLVFVLVKLAYVVAMGGLSQGWSLEGLLGRGSRFFSRNPNFFDDYAVILICASGWTTYLAARNSQTGIRWLLAVPFVMVTIFFFNIVVFSESRAGWIGVAAASLVIFLALVWFRKLPAVALMVLVLVAMTAMHWDRIAPEATKSWPALERTLMGNSAEGAQQEVSGGGSEQPAPAPATTDEALQGEEAALSNCEDGTATVEDLAGTGKDLNISLRLAVYEFAFKAWLARPILGYGAYDKYRLVEDIPADDRCAVLYMDHTHNLYLHLAVSGGLILLLPVVLFVSVPLLLFGFAVLRKSGDALLYLPGAAFGAFFLAENLFGLNFTNIHLGVAISWLLITVVSFVIVQGNARNAN